VPVSLELVQGGDIPGNPATLIYDVAVPTETECLQRAQDPVRAPGHDAGSIQILDPDEPAAAVMARVEIAPDGGQE
jgi:hypothetical protein